MPNDFNSLCRFVRRVSPNTCYLLCIIPFKSIAVVASVSLHALFVIYDGCCPFAGETNALILLFVL